MSYEQDETAGSFGKESARGSNGADAPMNRGRDEVFSQRVPAGKRTYFFDVKSTRSGDDFFITITESKRVADGRYEKHKIFLYKEDFGKFVQAMHDVVNHIKVERLPDYEFRGLPELSPSPVEEKSAPPAESAAGIPETPAPSTAPAPAPDPEPVAQSPLSNPADAASMG